MKAALAAAITPPAFLLAKAWWTACDVAIEAVLRAQRAGYYGVILVPGRINPALLPGELKVDETVKPRRWRSEDLWV